MKEKNKMDMKMTKENQDLKIPKVVFMPLAIAMGITLLLEMFKSFNKIPDIAGGYIMGVLVMWVSFMLVYYGDLRRQK